MPTSPSASWNFVWLELREAWKSVSVVTRFHTVLTNDLSGHLAGETATETMMGGATSWPGLLSYANFLTSGQVPGDGLWSGQKWSLDLFLPLSHVAPKNKPFSAFHCYFSV